MYSNWKDLVEFFSNLLWLYREKHINTIHDRASGISTCILRGNNLSKECGRT